MECNKIPNTVFYPVPNCNPSVSDKEVNDFVNDNEGYITSENAEKVILQTRKRFEACLHRCNGPVIIPTMFMNHPDRSTFYRDECNRLNKKAKEPPDETLFTFTFAKDVYVNLLMNFSEEYGEGKYKALIKYKLPAKIIFLNKESSAEKAFIEMISKNPFMYACSFEQRKKSPFIDRDIRRWNRGIAPCTNNIQFVVDFSVIYPQDIWSSVFVHCYDCGKFGETIFCDSIKEAARSEIWHNISRYKIQVSGREQFVIRFPCTSILHESCAFCEGLMGVVCLPLSEHATKPSLFVRVRLTFYSPGYSPILPALHKEGKEHFYSDLALLIDQLELK